MITVTPEALERLSQKLETTQAGPDMAWRFRRSAGRWKLHLDRIRPEDETFAHKQRRVLLLDRAVASALGARTLMTRETKSGPRLSLRQTPSVED